MNHPESIESEDKKPKIKMRLTASGWMLFFLLIWLPISAIGTANNFLIIVFTLALGVAIVSAHIGKKNVRALAVTRRFPDEIFAETPFEMEYLLKASDSAISLNFKEQEPLKEASEGVWFSRIDQNRNATKPAYFTIGSRGDKRIGPGLLQSGYPFGFATYSRECCNEDSILIFPKIDSVSHDLPSWIGNLGRGRERANPFGTIPYSLRDYMPGDPFKNIEWKKTARTGTFISKVLGEEEAMEITIRLPRIPSEKAISRAASLVVYFSRTRTPICLQGTGLNLGPARGKEFTRELLSILARWDDRSASDADFPRNRSAATVDVDESGGFLWSRPGDVHAIHPN